MTALDWTEGGEGTVYQSCSDCGHRWYFRRDFCPACGAREPETHQASGAGTVYAVTTVERAPSPEWREHAPYHLMLIDMDEGVRVMTHAEPGFRIGDRAQIRYLRIGERLVPRAERVDEPRGERGA